MEERFRWKEGKERTLGARGENLAGGESVNFRLCKHSAVEKRAKVNAGGKREGGTKRGIDGERVRLGVRCTRKGQQSP